MEFLASHPVSQNLLTVRQFGFRKRRSAADHGRSGGEAAGGRCEWSPVSSFEPIPAKEAHNGAARGEAVIPS